MNTNLCIKIILLAIVCFVIGVIGGVYFARDDGRVGVCIDGQTPDKNGCCAGEIYTDMGELGWNCCPENTMLDCFPPIGS